MVHHSELVFACERDAFQDLTDTDYDFPAGAEDADNHEWEEYDEPQPVIPDTSQEEREETNIVYDDPVQRYR